MHYRHCGHPEFGYSLARPLSIVAVEILFRLLRNGHHIACDDQQLAVA